MTFFKIICLKEVIQSVKFSNIHGIYVSIDKIF